MDICYWVLLATPAPHDVTSARFVAVAALLLHSTTQLSRPDERWDCWAGSVLGNDNCMIWHQRSSTLENQSSVIKQVHCRMFHNCSNSYLILSKYSSLDKIEMWSQYNSWCWVRVGLCHYHWIIISSSSVCLPWLVPDQLVHPEQQLLLLPQPCLSYHPSPVSWTLWTPAPDNDSRVISDDVQHDHHLSLSVARLHLQQSSNILQCCGILLQLGVANGKIVEVVSLVGFISVLKTKKL